MSPPQRPSHDLGSKLHGIVYEVCHFPGELIDLIGQWMMIPYLKHSPLQSR